MQKPMIAGVEPIKTSLKEGEEYFFAHAGAPKRSLFAMEAIKGHRLYH